MTGLRIGEAAQRTGVSAANIRYYEKQGLLAPALRQDNDYRLYGDADLHRLRFIRMCRAMDMSLDEVRTLLALDGQRPEDCHAASQTVEAHLQHVRQRLGELRVLERELRQLKTLCDGRPGACNLIATLHAQADAELPPEPGSHVKRHV
ncbi:MerR family transcriptional regulator [Comamonas aquatica]|jgi:DNA-binding transcriptional MerR regulator|uniref:MerR family transcriptional regulator n=1 Tax=Comamonas aquatica TaxID=225991 RepID=A0AA42HRJ1_9BURK|nr:MerR family transcriptional regulator [Comamonas aquatica]MDH0362863.1 MerR family transcriptional regulator [Comamonas aquatica]MDH0899727.1 MerR family transcriptional regulator [Comamonas aquatica]MDH1428017.1 MerR family transcriptional regulator [Comamonas aquatica]MDH1605938.1 MerR family transcriptional regulator [Comamonas aquatica]MDH1616308.1 MerR family transcriptional regulator [Comamonas aquatica]